jgi:hypothetical protein
VVVTFEGRLLLLVSILMDCRVLWLLLLLLMLVDGLSALSHRCIVGAIVVVAAVALKGACCTHARSRKEDCSLDIAFRDSLLDVRLGILEGAEFWICPTFVGL